VKIDDNNRACCRAGEKDPGRRRFLARLGVAVGSLIAFMAGLPVISYILLPVSRKMHRKWVSVGPADRFAVDDTVLVSFKNPSATPWAGVTGKTGAWVRRVGDSEFIAFVLNCSHLGCPVSWEASPKLFICPCHGSVYYRNCRGGPRSLSSAAFPGPSARWTGRTGEPPHSHHRSCDVEK